MCEICRRYVCHESCPNAYKPSRKRKKNKGRAREIVFRLIEGYEADGKSYSDPLSPAPNKGSK